MPITDHVERIPIESILIDREGRQRREVRTDDLDDSIRRRGVVTPIVCQRLAAPSEYRGQLVAGERRIVSSLKVGLLDIPVRWTEDLSEIELQIIELEENIKRQDLQWQDQLRAVERIHNLYISLDEGWTMTETARNIGLSLGTVSSYLRVAANLNEERVASSSNWREAYNVLARREAREQGNALEELLDLPSLSDSPIPTPTEGLGGSTVPATATDPPDSTALIDPIQHISFLDWAPVYSGPKFNFIHCDFPYGIEAFSGPQTRGLEATSALYKDSPDIYFSLLECLCRNLNRFMSLSSHLMFWCSSEIMGMDSDYSRKTWQIFHSLAPTLEFYRFPLIWLKSDNAGVAADPRHGPRHVYETCLLASRGSRQIVRVVADAYAAPTDRSLHPSTKPEPMLRHFMRMLVDETSAVLDPTAGSGAALRAADSLGASRLLGLEIDPEHVRVANQAFRNGRLLHSANKVI